MILCDTNIIIEFYKNNPTIVNELRLIGVDRLTISVITQAELYYGALNKAELLKIQKHLNLLPNLPIDNQVSIQFIQLMERYSHAWERCLEEHCAELKGHRILWQKDADPYRIKLIKSAQRKRNSESSHSPNGKSKPID